MKPGWVDIAVPRPWQHLLTYAVPQTWSDEEAMRLKPGLWVEVPLGRGSAHGCVVRTHVERPKELDGELVLKDVSRIVVDQGILHEDVLELCKWASRYYVTPLGELLQCALPQAVLKALEQEGKSRSVQRELASPAKLSLNAEQNAAVSTILESTSPVLLEGVTGSGKTEVYLEVARSILAQGRSVLVLVPEIALTPQLHERIELGLGTPVALWHSAVAANPRADLWRGFKDGRTRVVVGARSAVFAPLEHLGLIVIDEEHDGSYKQEERARYHARELALYRAHKTGSRLVLGSATPSLETLERVASGKMKHAKLNSRFGAAHLPAIEIVDLSEVEHREDSQALFAPRTLAALAETIDRGEQAMVYLNRRGFAASLLCQECGWVAPCDDCSVSLSVYMRSKNLRCHMCGKHQRMPDQCPKCQGHAWKLIGAGTESLEDQLADLIPSKNKARLLRLDRDQVTSQSRLVKVLKKFRDGEADVLLGTQMLVKGHDFPKVTLVVVVLADSLLRFPDFRAAERAYQTLTQMSGRAGRSELPGRVLIQTFQPDHPVLRVLTGAESVEDWRKEESAIRQEFGYPPYMRVVRLRFESVHVARARALAEEVARNPIKGMEWVGPSEAPISKVKQTFRWDLWLKSPRIEPLHAAIRRAQEVTSTATAVRMQVDLDPYAP